MADAAQRTALVKSLENPREARTRLLRAFTARLWRALTSGQLSQGLSLTAQGRTEEATIRALFGVAQNRTAEARGLFSRLLRRAVKPAELSQLVNGRFDLRDPRADPCQWRVL